MVFTSPVRVKTFFTFKDKLPKVLLSGLVYKHKCGGWNATYMLHLTGYNVKIDNNKITAFQEHLLCCNYSPSSEDFSV